MRIGKLRIAPLILVVLLVFVGSVKSVQVQPIKCEGTPFLEVNLQEEILLGETQTIEVRLTQCKAATYIVFVLSPGDLQCLESEGADFIQWLKNYEWSTFKWNDFKTDLKDWLSRFQSCEIDVACKWGTLNKLTDPEDTLTYPNEFTKLIGDPNTDEEGKYDVITIGIGACGNCCIQVNHFHSTFFAVPEFTLGTITPLLSGLGLTALLGWIAKRKR